MTQRTVAGSELSENARRVLAARYLRRDERGEVAETAEELFARVAKAVAQAELFFRGPREAARREEEFEELLASRDFLPNSPTLMNAGSRRGQLAACFVLPVHDSMEAIFQSLKEMALVQRSGGGTGFSFSRLRPRGARLAASGGRASGPVSFMKVFDGATEHIRLGGRRRGANMGVLRVDHPDILEFVRAKRAEGALRNFNLSVAVPDAFLEAAHGGDPYDLIDPRWGRKVGELDAGEVFDEIVGAAWAGGDPGLLFVDAIERDNPVGHLGRVESTNPCGEVPLLPHESCDLGSVNLAHMIRDGGEGRPTVDHDRLSRTVRLGVRFLDDVIEVNRYPTAATERAARRTRKIGLGVMGFAEMLVRLGIPYDSTEAVGCAEEVMAAIQEAAREASADLAAARGVFPAWRGSDFEARGLRLRNATRTAVAPTGTISILADTTASIEPLFALAYHRSHVLEGERLEELNPLFVAELRRRGMDADRIVSRLLVEGSLERVEGVPPDLRRLFATALEIPAERHLRVQAAFQRHVDNSVSKTVNLPAEATPKDVRDAYRRAWELGLKGVTVYRYGSKSAQVLELGAGEEALHLDHASPCDPTECLV